MYHPSPRVFKTNKTFLLSSDGLAQYCMNLSQWFTQRNSSILYGAVHNPITFSQLWSLARCLQPLTQKLWLPVWDAISFICTHTCTLKRHLAMTRNLFPKIAELERTQQRAVYLGMGSTSRCIHPEKGWPGVWTDAWVSDSTANTASVAINYT